MSIPREKVVVLRKQTRDTVRPEMLDKEFLIDLRRGLLQALNAIEKEMEKSRRCPRCELDLSAK